MSTKLEGAAASEAMIAKNRFCLRSLRKKMPFIIFCGIIAVGIIPLLIIAMYNHPSADDYSYTVEFMRPTVLNGGGLVDIIKAAIDTSAAFYNTWQGLYTSAFFLALQPAIFGEQFYSLTTAILMLATLGTFLYFFYVIRKYVLDSTSKAWAPIAVIAWFYFTQALPSPVQGLYWYNGAINYVLLWCFYTLTISFAMVSLCSKGKKTVVFLGLATVMAFITAGGNHPTTIACIFTLALILVVQIARTRRFSMALPLVVCIIGLAIVMMAPGTAIRSEALHINWSSRFELVKVLMQSPFIIGEYVGRWMNLSYFCYLLIMVPFAFDLYRTSCRKPVVSIPVLVVSMICIVLLMVAMICPQLYATKSRGSGRLTNVIFLSFLIWSTLLFVFSVIHLADRYSHVAPMKKLLAFFDSSDYPLRSYSAASAFLCVILLTYGSALGFQGTTWYEACTEILSGSAAQYDREVDARISLLEDPDVREVVVDPISSQPMLLFFSDLGEDPYDWPNDTIARYYGKDYVGFRDQYPES